MNEKAKKSLSVSFLACLTSLTCLPLLLMFYGSLKPAGTLEKPLKDFSLTAFQENRSLIDGKTVFVSPLRMDMRKFKTLEVVVKGEKSGGQLLIRLRDILGNETTVSRSITTEWQRLSIPMHRFLLQKLNPPLPEKVAEELWIIADAESGISLKEARFTFKPWTFLNYKDVLVSGFFGRYFFNSLFITLVVVFGNLLFAPMVGYAFARKNFPGKEPLFLLVLGSLMIPPQLFMVPVFLLMKQFQWLNSYWALTIPSLVIPFNIFLMRQYISAIPPSLEDAARIDGAGELQIFVRIVLPLSKPALAVVGINTFIGSWNTFLYPFLLTNTPEMRTLPVGLALYKNLQGVDWVHLLAGASLTALPVILVFLFFQRYIIAGLTAGPVKKK